MLELYRKTDAAYWAIYETKYEKLKKFLPTFSFMALPVVISTSILMDSDFMTSFIAKSLLTEFTHSYL